MENMQIQQQWPERPGTVGTKTSDDNCFGSELENENEKSPFFGSKRSCRIVFQCQCKISSFLETIQTLINCWFSLSNRLCLDLGIDIPDLDFYYLSFLGGRFFYLFSEWDFSWSVQDLRTLGGEHCC